MWLKLKYRLSDDVVIFDVDRDILRSPEED